MSKRAIFRYYGWFKAVALSTIEERENYPDIELENIVWEKFRKNP